MSHEWPLTSFSGIGEEMWHGIMRKTISCVEDDSPNIAILANILGKAVSNKYQVPEYNLQHLMEYTVNGWLKSN